MIMKLHFSKLLGLIRLAGISLILILLVGKINLGEPAIAIENHGIGSVIGLLSILVLVYYHFIKGIHEVRNKSTFEK